MRRVRNIIVVSVAMLMLCVPLVLTVGRSAAFSASENRMLAPLPGLPTTWRQLSDFPARADAYLRDNLGLRGKMTLAYATIRVWVLRSGNENVLLGHDGWLFYRGEDNLEKSAGLYRRADEIARTAEILAAMQRDLVRRGAKLIVAVPPNKATIQQAALPA